MSTLFHEDGTVTLHHGDALKVARGVASESVNCIVTSPPYFGLRDYGEAGQIGAEASVGDYVVNMVELFSELRRVLADDGTLWLNLGDSYGSGKQLLGVPWLVALALQDEGWILRSDIIWAKPNGMPESVTDRPASKHEHIFLFAKSPSYYFDLDAIRVPHSTATVARLASGPVKIARRTPGETREPSVYGAASGTNLTATGERHNSGHSAGKNPGNVWTVPTVPFSSAHFAVYPPELIRPCILAGSRAGDVVLDPFSGSGTTGMVATQEGRKYVGIDLNRDYLNLSLKTRFAQPVLNLGETA
jgi:DNA modification methylase